MTAQPPNEELLRVLVVEHDQEDAERCVHELQTAGFLVHADVVATPGGFVARLGGRPYDVVLADYRLRGWTGMEALWTLQNAGADIPFILGTAYRSPSRRPDSR